MSGKHRNLHGGPHNERMEHYSKNSPPKSMNDMLSYGKQRPSKASANYKDTSETGFGLRPSYQDFHPAIQAQNDGRQQIKQISSRSKSRDSSHHRRKQRDRHEENSKSIETNSQKRQSRMPDWMNFRGQGVGQSQVYDRNMHYVNPDEFWRGEKIGRSPDKDEPFPNRRGSHKKQGNKDNFEPKHNDIRARSKSKERRSGSKKRLDGEREFQSLAYFDRDINQSQPPLLTSERKPAKDKRGANGYNGMDYLNDISLQNTYHNSRQDITRQLFHNARYPIDEPRSLNYPAAESEFHSPANWMLGQRLTNHLYSQQHRLPNQQQNHSRQIPRDMRYPATNKSLKGSSQYGLISFGPRGGYNSGGTSGSGSSSQDAQKSPASRTSSKISYDSTGPHDERYYVTPNESSDASKFNQSPDDRNMRYKHKTEKLIEMTVPLNDLIPIIKSQRNTKSMFDENHDKRKRVKGKSKEKNSKSIKDHNKYLFSTKSNELVSSDKNSEKKSLNELRSKDSPDKYNFQESPIISRGKIRSNRISVKHKDLSKSSPHLGNTTLNIHTSTSNKKQTGRNEKDYIQRSCDKIIDQKMKDKDDTESGIDIPEPDYSPILIRRDTGQEEYVDFDYDLSLFQHSEVKKNSPQNISNDKNTKSKSPTLWKNASRYRGSLEKVLIEEYHDAKVVQDEQKQIEGSTGSGYSKASMNKVANVPHDFSEPYIADKKQSKHQTPVNYNPNPLRTEEEAIMSLEKALTGRSKVKDMVEKLKKETERDRVKQELRRSAFLVSQCQENDQGSTGLLTNNNNQKMYRSGSSDALSIDAVDENDNNKDNLGKEDLVIEDLEIYGDPDEDADDKEQDAIDIYKDLLSVALEQEKLEDMRQSRAKLNGLDLRENPMRNKKQGGASLKGHSSNTASELSLKGSSPTKYSTRGRRGLTNEHSGSGSSRLDGYDRSQSRPNSSNHRRRDESLSPERSHHLSTAPNDNYTLSYSQDDLLDSRKDNLQPQSIMRSQPNINMFTNPAVSSYPDGTRDFSHDEEKGVLNLSNEDNVHTRQSHFFNSLFPSRANRFGYPVYPERHFGIPTPQASGPVSFAGFSPDLRNQTFYDPENDVQESGSPSLMTDLGQGTYYSSTSTSLLSSVPKLFKASNNTKSKKTKKTGKKGFFSFFH